ncbi:MAG TPA: hypothetical protein VF545_11770 [Thermoleophilaceae bacterium]|jgi:hypothetical protein
MAGRPITRAATAAALCAGLAVAGCSGERDTSEGRRVEAVVKRFALSHGPETCALFTAKAVVSVYGLSSRSPRVARANCLARSKTFEGAPVTVTFVKINTDTSAHASAQTPDGKSFYTVGLLKLHGRWLIDSVVRKQKPG